MYLYIGHYLLKYVLLFRSKQKCLVPELILQIVHSELSQSLNMQKVLWANSIFLVLIMNVHALLLLTFKKLPSYNISAWIERFFWLLNPHIRLSYIFKPYVNPECAAHMQRFGIKRRQGLKVTSTKTKEPILETLFFPSVSAFYSWFRGS